MLDPPRLGTEALMEHSYRLDWYTNSPDNVQRNTYSYQIYVYIAHIYCDKLQYSHTHIFDIVSSHVSFVCVFPYTTGSRNALSAEHRASGLRNPEPRR